MSDPRDPDRSEEATPETEASAEAPATGASTDAPMSSASAEAPASPPESAPADLPPTSSAPLPPYAAPGYSGNNYPGGSYPGGGYPGAPGYPGAAPVAGPPMGAPLVQPYPGAPPAAAYGTSYPPPAMPGAIQPPDARPKSLAVTGIVLAGVGLIMAFVPFVTWFSGFVLLAAFVVALIALIKKTQGAKGLSIAALAISVVGWIVSVVVSFASFALLADATYDEILPGPSAEVSDPPVDEEAADPAADVDDLVVVETAFGRTSYDPQTWWYAVVLENPNPDYVFETLIDIEAVGADGTILDTASDYPTVLSGRVAMAGVFTAVGQGEVASLNVLGLDASEAYSAPYDETGSFVVGGLASTSDGYSTTVTGTVSGDFDSDQEFVSVVILARSAEGAIIEAEYTYVDRLPSDGTPVQFEAVFYEEFPAGTTFEALPTL